MKVENIKRLRELSAKAREEKIKRERKRLFISKTYVIYIRLYRLSQVKRVLKILTST